MSDDRNPRQENRDQSAEDLLPRVYDELRKLAEFRLRSERSNHTLQPTALVHEAYIKIVGADDPGWANRAHFFKAAAEAMRRILIDHAKTKGRAKRGGGARQVPLDIVDLARVEDSNDILALNEAIRRLEECDLRMSEVVKLRFFAGLSVEETSAVLGVSTSTVKREWTVARAWLFKQLGDDSA